MGDCLRVAGRSHLQCFGRSSLGPVALRLVQNPREQTTPEFVIFLSPRAPMLPMVPIEVPIINGEATRDVGVVWLIVQAAFPKEFAEVAAIPHMILSMSQRNKYQEPASSRHKPLLPFICSLPQPLDVFLPTYPTRLPKYSDVICYSVFHSTLGTD